MTYNQLLEARLKALDALDSKDEAVRVAAEIVLRVMPKLIDLTNHEEA